MSTTYVNVKGGIVKGGYHYHFKVWLRNYIVQDCKHSDKYRERVEEEHCCNSHKYQGKDIRELMSNYYYQF